MEQRTKDLILSIILTAVISATVTLSCIWLVNNTRPNDTGQGQYTGKPFTYCLYEIPDFINFDCNGKNASAFDMSLFAWKNSQDQGCKVADAPSVVIKEQTNSTHYQIGDCDLDVPFKFKTINVP